VINGSDAIGDQPGAIRVRTGVVRADRATLTTAVIGQDLPEDDYVFLEVTDTGCGMNAETKAKIFDPFFTTKFTGRGLGLAAVLGVIRGHHGALRLQSEPGHGTTFTVLLPRAIVLGELFQDKSKNTPATWRGQGTVLVVDDED